MICNYLFPFDRLFFHFIGSFLFWAEAFRFDVITFVYFGFVPLLRSRVQISTTKTDARACRLCSLLGASWLQALHQVSDPLRANLCVQCETWISFHSSICGCPAFPVLFIEETVVSPLHALCSFVTS